MYLMKKDKLEILSKKIKNAPFGTKDYESIRKEIRKVVRDKYPNQFVLCTPSKYSQSENKNLSTLVDISPYNHQFSQRKTIFEDPALMFIPREDAEYNFEFKQINVFTLLTDGKKCIVLKKRSDKTFTMVGGHVDYDFEAYKISQLDLLRKNMQKEMDEEIRHNDILYVPSFPSYIMNTYNKFHDLFHIGIIFILHVPEIDFLFSELKTGEPEKHDIVMIDKLDLLKDKSTHHWIKLVLDKEYEI